MSPSTLQTLEAGQLYYNTKYGQHAVVVGHNGIGWLLQYEDGDIVELGGPGYANHLSDRMVYKPAPPHIESRRPTLENACKPTEHVFFADPTTPHERTDKSLRCAKCGLEHEILVDDIGHFPEADNQLRGKCQHCEGVIPPGEPEKMPFSDMFTCSDCNDEIEGMGWERYKEQFGDPLKTA